MTRSFRDDGELEIDDEHGTAVAEIIYDIEQGMTLYLAAVETFGEIDEDLGELSSQDRCHPRRNLHA